MKPLLSPSAAVSAVACLLLTAALAVAASTAPALPAGSSPSESIPASFAGQPVPQAPFDTTVITPVESAGAARGE
jgi:hypothetical protein